MYYAKRKVEKSAERASPAPSKRYMNLLIGGARKSKLDPGYIAKLEEVPTYSPPDHILQLRSTRPGWNNGAETCLNKMKHALNPQILPN